jgi:hypothetical protein
VSDLQRGSVRPADVQKLPDGVGLRFVAVGRHGERSSFAGADVLAGDGAATRSQTIETMADTTAVVLEEPMARAASGLRLVASPRDEQSVGRLIRAVAVAGAPAGSDAQPIVVRFAEAPPQSEPVQMIRSGWMLRTALRLREDPSLGVVAGEVAGPASDGAWAVLRRGSDGRLVRAAALGRELVLDVAARPDSLFAAEVVRAALIARVGAESYDEREIAGLAEGPLLAMSRAPGTVTSDAWRNADSTDARWLWLLALGLLACEHWLRSRTRAPQRLEVSREAA